MANKAPVGLREFQARPEWSKGCKVWEYHWYSKFKASSDWEFCNTIYRAKNSEDQAAILRKKGHDVEILPCPVKKPKA